MNPNLLEFVLILTIVTILTAWKSKDLRFPSLIAIVFVFSIAEVFTNYPMVWRDVYLHGSAAKGIIEQGHIADTWNAYPQTNPGFFLLSTVFTLVTGLDLIPSNLLILLPVAIVLLVVMLVTIYRRLSIGLPYVATLLAFLLMNFNTNEFTFVHFNTRLLSLVYVLLFLLLFLAKPERKNVVLLFVVNFALVITHPLNSLVPMAFLTIYWISERKRSQRGPLLALSCIMFNAAWLIYFSATLLATGFGSFLNLQYAASTVQGWSPALARPMPLFGSFLSTYYKVLVVTLTLISLYAAVKFRKETRIRILAVYLLSIALVYGLSFLSALKDISVNRGIMAASVSIAALPIMLFVGAKQRARYFGKNWKRYVVIGAVAALIVPNFIFVHELPVARYLSVGSIDSTCSFILNYRDGRDLVSLGDFPIYYCYYEPFYKDYVNLGFNGWTNLTTIADFMIQSPNHSLKILDYRKVIDWGAILGNSNTYSEALEEWNAEVYERMDSVHNVVYSNGFETIYER